MATTISNDPRPVLRQELSRVFKNQRVIRAFEQIFDLIPPEFINQQIQIDELNSALSALPSIDGLREEIGELQKQIQALQQGPVI